MTRTSIVNRRVKCIRTPSSCHIILIKYYHRAYRMHIDEEIFGQIRYDSGTWQAEIRSTDTGRLIRYAGIWNTLAEAAEELFSLTPEGQAYLEARR